MATTATSSSAPIKVQPAGEAVGAAARWASRPHRRDRALRSSPRALGDPFEATFNRVQWATKKALTELIDACYRAHRTRRRCSWPTVCAPLGYDEPPTRGRHVHLHGQHGDPGEQGTKMLATRMDKVAAWWTSTRGVITDGERYNKIVDIWRRRRQDLQEMMEQVGKSRSTRPGDGHRRTAPSVQPIFMMADSARARGPPADPSAGRHARPHGQARRWIIEQPITANFREGLTVLQYFISTHGARKGWRTRRSRRRTRVT